MLDRGIGLPGPQPEPAALLPTPRETLIDLQSAINQCSLLSRAIQVLHTKVKPSM